MELAEAIKSRHAVRTYSDRLIEEDLKNKLNRLIGVCNAESGLHIQLVVNEPKAFNGMMAHYGKFSGVNNYIVIVGPKKMEEACGYYGEKIVLFAQQLGLNTCWVGMTYSKISGAFLISKGEKLHIVITIGYGETQGVSHKTKVFNDVVSHSDKCTPIWFENGINAALLAPTAMNQQKFSFSQQGNFVSAKAGFGFYTKIDLGIAKYHFELGAGIKNFVWAH